MLKSHLEAYVNGELIMEGYFYEVYDFVEELKNIPYVHGKQIQILDTTENEIVLDFWCK